MRYPLHVEAPHLIPTIYGMWGLAYPSQTHNRLSVSWPCNTYAGDVQLGGSNGYSGTNPYARPNPR